MIDDLISRQAAINMCREPRMRNADCSDFELEIMMLPPAQRWIPVSERLPEYGERVLATFRNKYIGKTTIGVSNCYVQKEGFFSDIPFEYAVVAWMPLPEPYKEGSNG